MPKKKTGARKKAEKQKARQKVIATKKESCSIYLFNLFANPDSGSQNVADLTNPDLASQNVADPTNPDSASQNVADPTNLDPKFWLGIIYSSFSLKTEN